MTSAPSIREGLSRVIIQVSIAWSFAVFAVVWVTVHKQLDAVLDSTLQESAEILYGLLQANSEGLVKGEGGSLPAPPHQERMVWQIVSVDQRVVWRSHSAPAQPLKSQLGSGFFSSAPEWHVYRMPFDSKGAMLYVAQPHGERVRAQFVAGLLTACGALVVGLISAVWLSRRASRELLPLIDLSEQVRVYHPMESGSIPPAATRQELLPLRDAIVHLGERLAQNIISERAFSANAAHALRTPLAGLGMQLALLQRESTQAGQVRIHRAREAADRLSRVVTALLSLFRSGGELSPTLIDLPTFFKNLPSTGLILKVEGQAQVSVDPDLLAAALLNLLDNSVRYGATQVDVRFDVCESGSVITMLDNGPGVDHATRNRINAALAGQNYEQNMGLGLMLADRVARSHEGRLQLVPSEKGFGVALFLGRWPG